MNCEICGRSVSEGKKHIIFECKGHNTGKIVLCKACISVGYLTAGNPTVYWDISASKAVVLEMAESFVYATLGQNSRKAYASIAEECGWEVVRYVKVRAGVVYVPELYDNSVVKRCFNLMVPGKWVKDAALSTEECFRKSCSNIRINYLGWILRENKWGN